MMISWHFAEVIEESTMGNYHEDISESELEAIYNQVDKEIAEHGLPSVEQILSQIDTLNYSAAS